MSRAVAFLRAWLLAMAAAALLCGLLPGTAAAATCAPATGQGTAPGDFRDYCWFDFTGYVDNTADNAAGQTFTFALPDGTKVVLNLRNNSTPQLAAVASPSWTGSAFGNHAFMGIPGRPVLYTVGGGQVSLTVTVLSVTPPSGGTSSYSIVVADGESSNAGESLVFTTNRGAWQRVADIKNGTSTIYPSLAYTNANRTVTLGGGDGAVGSYVFRSDNNPSVVNATLNAGGLQGIIIGMRYASVASVSQISNQRYNAADQFVYKVSTTAGTSLVAGTTTGTVTTGFTPAVVPTLAASYPFLVSQSLAPGSVGTAAHYTTRLTCVNANAGSSTPMPANLAASSYQFTNLQYGDSVLCTFTNTPLFNTINGTVYHDANHNGADDGAEAGPGVTGIYVKLAAAAGAICTAPALQAAAVDSATGAYQLANLPQGTYCLILDSNNTLSDVTPTVPAGWIATQNASGLLQLPVPLGSPLPPPQNFGLYKGSRLTGTVFGDTGGAASTPNNGVKEAAEVGLAGVTVTATSGATAVASAVSSGDGSFILWVPASVSASVTLAPATPAGHIATGGSPGSSGGTYTRPNLAYVPAAGQSYTGVGFGFATPNTLGPNGAQTAQAGTVVFYAHTFEAGSGGQVNFSLAGVATPAATSWSTVLYRDTNCSGALDSAEPLLNASIAVTAGQAVCLVVKQFVPAGAAFGAQNTATLSATFTYTNAVPALSVTLAASDVTTVGEASALSLKKLVGNVSRGGATSTSVNASPGEVLQYTVTAQNNGATSLSTLVINDATPAFTTFVAAACPATLPTGITACTIGTQPASGGQGGVQWTFTGTLASGAQLAVTYQVKVSE